MNNFQNSKKKIILPLSTPDKSEIELDISDFPNLFSEILIIIEREKYSPSIIREISLVYHSLGHTDKSKILLQKGVDLFFASIFNDEEAYASELANSTTNNVSNQGNKYDSKRLSIHSIIQPLKLIVTSIAISIQEILYLSFSPCVLEANNDLLLNSNHQIHIDNIENLIKKSNILIQLGLSSTKSLDYVINFHDEFDYQNNLLYTISSHIALVQAYPGFKNEFITPLLCYGYYFICQYYVSDNRKDKTMFLSKANNIFEITLYCDSSSVFSLLGLSIVFMNESKFQDCLKALAQTLILYPQGPAYLRSAIGYCYFKLCDFDRAIKAYERCLQLHANNITALISVGIIKLFKNISLQKLPMDNYLNELELNLKLANEIHPNHPLVYLVIINLGFFSDIKETYFSCYESNYLLTIDSSIIFQLKFNIGRIKHIEGKWEEAMKYYNDTIIAEPSHIAARLYLAQVLLKLGNWKKSEKHLIMLMKLNHPYCEVYTLFGLLSLLYAEMHLSKSNVTKPDVSIGNPLDSWLDKSFSEKELPNFSSNSTSKEKFVHSIKYFNISKMCLDKSLEIVPYNENILLLRIRIDEILFQCGYIWMLSSLTKFYMNILELPLDSTDISCIPSSKPVQLINNFGILMFLDGDTTKSLKCFELALNFTKENDNNKIWARIPLIQQVILYNHYRALRQLGQNKLANKKYGMISKYKSSFILHIIQKYYDQMVHRPNYVEQECHKYLTSKAPLSYDINLILIYLYIRTNHFNKAYKMLIYLISSKKRPAHYLLLLLGDITYKMGEKKKKVEYMSKALKYYQKALKNDPLNWYAAHGIAVVLGYLNNWDRSLHILSTLLDVSKETSKMVLSRYNVSSKYNFIKKNVYIMECTCHANLGAVYFNLSMQKYALKKIDSFNYDNISIILNKAIYHSKSALVFHQFSKQLINQLIQMYYFAKKYKENKIFIENALCHYPDDVLLQVYYTKSMLKILGSTTLNNIQEYYDIIKSLLDFHIDLYHSCKNEHGNSYVLSEKLLKKYKYFLSKLPQTSILKLKEPFSISNISQLPSIHHLMEKSKKCELINNAMTSLP